MPWYVWALGVGFVLLLGFVGLFVWAWLMVDADLWRLEHRDDR